jgi:DNA repair protein RecO (recombination protein O)
MNQIVTTAIVLGRIEYGEADRIITLLTPDQGKLRLMAKGVRRVKSKLAGGIELFSVSQVTFIRGRGEIGTLVSTRLDKHYGHIVSDIERVQLGYELIKLIDKTTEDEPEPIYFDLLKDAFDALNQPAIDLHIIRTWFCAQLLRAGGHQPSFESDTTDQPLRPDGRYRFDAETMALARQPDGPIGGNEIKCMRLFFGTTKPATLHKITAIGQLLPQVDAVVRPAFDLYVRR